jgi:hypothetical protein
MRKGQRSKTSETTEPYNSYDIRWPSTGERVWRGCATCLIYHTITRAQAKINSTIWS